jgi:hypothetical protein
MPVSADWPTTTPAPAPRPPPIAVLAAGLSLDDDAHLSGLADDDIAALAD